MDITKKEAIDIWLPIIAEGVKGMPGCEEAFNMAFNSLKTDEAYNLLYENKDAVEVVRCKNCQHFEYDHVENVSGVPLIVAHEICNFWGEGCKTHENGYCFAGVKKE